MIVNGNCNCNCDKLHLVYLFICNVRYNFMNAFIKESPTTQFYDDIQFSFKHLYKILFDDSLAAVMLTFVKDKSKS
jgi:hypothetical protein